jgi:hypothetical protein
MDVSAETEAEAEAEADNWGFVSIGEGKFFHTVQCFSF